MRDSKFALFVDLCIYARIQNILSTHLVHDFLYISQIHVYRMFSPWLPTVFAEFFLIKTTVTTDTGCVNTRNVHEAIITCKNKQELQIRREKKLLQLPSIFFVIIINNNNNGKLLSVPFRVWQLKYLRGNHCHQHIKSDNYFNQPIIWSIP